MNEFEDKLNHSLREKIEKYEDELNTIRSDYEQNQERIRRELYQVISEKKDNIVEEKKQKKRNKTLRKFIYRIKQPARRIKKYFKNIINQRKKCEN